MSSVYEMINFKPTALPSRSAWWLIGKSLNVASRDVYSVLKYYSLYILVIKHYEVIVYKRALNYELLNIQTPELLSLT